ncbi:unnamed protein product [Mytilus edulis]|uniref:Mab-21-like nucleotidyltransferase domain-containing protein n=1 Tax=Mytilus edulis TaxID=6550 RepID=A0A8S3S566_MYTED|nr:unnamed protein product [Mytilus edulis]
MATDYTAASKSDLHKAAVDGDVECVVKLLNGGDVQIDLEDDRGNTPLYMAVQNNHFQVVKTLIQYGACINPTCVPLNIVRNFEIAKLLVDSGSSVTAVDELGNNPLHKATEFGNDRIAELFLNNGADINQTNHNGQNALHLACKNSSDENRFQTVQMLIRYGIDVNTLDNLKRSPLHHACQNAKTNNIIGLLVAKNAVFKEHDFQGMCPIHYLLDYYHLYDPEDESLFLAGIDKLLQGEDCANVTDAAGKTPLHYAAEKTTDRIVSFLLSRGSNANISDGFGRTPLHFVNSVETCFVLTSGGCNPDIKDFWGQAAVHLATERKDIEIVKEMMNTSTNFDEGDVKGRTILHIAASNGSDDIVMLFLKKGMNANITDNFSNTPLHLATWNDHTSTVELLLENKGDPYFKDENRNTAFDLSLYRSSEDTIDILSKYINRTGPKESQCKFTNYADSLMHLDDFEKVISCNDMIKTSETDMNIFVGKLFEHEMPYSRNCESEVKEIQLAVEAMASNLADMVNKHDPIFKCTLLHIGSVSEGTKVRYPDEFDFTFCLEVISDASYPEYKEEETMTQIAVALPYSTGNKTISDAFVGIEPEEEVTSISGYAYLHSSNKMISNLLSEWAADDDLLSSCQMNYLFSKLLTKVMFASDFPKDERLIIKEVTIHPEVLLQWRGSRFKDLQISVDIVPAVRLPSWPPTVNKESILLTKDMMMLPSIAVPKMTSGENEDLWRCSMVLQEIAIFRNMLPKIRNSYIVSKILVHSHVCPQVNFGGNEEMKEYYGHLKGLSEEDLEGIYMYESIESLIPSYLLKMAFLQAVEKHALTNGIHSVYCQVRDKSNQRFDTHECSAPAYGLAETMFHMEHSSDVDIPLVRELFSMLETGLLNRFVSSSLNPKQNVLNAKLLSGDAEKVHKYVKFILKLLE